MEDFNEEEFFNFEGCDENVKKFTADFETCTWLEDETYVWAWAVCDIDSEDIKIGTNIDEFIEFCKVQKNSKMYFHNLKFDGEFLIYWALKNGFTHVEDKKELEPKTFTTLISNFGQFYQIVLYFDKNTKVTFIDSLKIIPFSVDVMAKSFGLPISKLKIDYNEFREIGHALTDVEKDYIKNDVLIVAKCLKTLFKEGLDKMTQGSNALNDYKSKIKVTTFEHQYPQIDYDLDKNLRLSYKGGFTYLNPIYKEKVVENVVNLDVNSLYPYCMRTKLLPFGEAEFFEGEYKENKIYPLFIQRLTCTFEIKENKIPTIQIKNNSRFRENEYLLTSGEEPVALTLTNIDLKLFLEHYNVKNLKYICGWMFKGKEGMFNDYIDKWIERKNEATISGNKGQRTLCKLMLNSLYGKFATSQDAQSKIPYLEEDIVHYKLGKEDTKKGLYIPMGCFITAYARELTIRTSQKIKEYSLKKYGEDMYIYSDTDSIKTLLSSEELEKFCEIDDVKLGAWKNEGIATKAKFIRQKCYLEVFGEEIQITCAGMPKTCYDKVTFENFKTGFSCSGKLTFKHVKGGVKLVETDFTIKEAKELTKDIDKI